MIFYQNFFALLSITCCIFTVSAKREEKYQLTLLNPSLTVCNIDNLKNPIFTDINCPLYFWPQEYSKLDKSDKWIAYINGTDCGNIEQNILSAQSNNSTVIVLYAYPTKLPNCIPKSDEFWLPLFINVDEQCKNFTFYNNSNSSNLNAWIKYSTEENNGSSGLSSDSSSNDNMIETYQTAMIVLYAISGAVLGIFIVIVVSNLVKRRLQSRQPIHPIGGNNQHNRGITKAILDSFPVYSFSLKKNVNEDVEKGHDTVATHELETLKTVDDEKGDSTVGEINQVEKTHEIFNLSKENKEIKDKNIVTTDENTTNNQSQNSLNNDNSTLFNNKITEVQSTCPICLGDFELGEEVRILPCGHQYHTSCIDTWLLEISSLCPMCKADYTSWNIDLSNSLHGDISASTDSSGMLNEQLDIVEDNNNGDSNGNDNNDTDSGNNLSLQHSFPHFRWVKYLTSIRRRRRNRRRNTRISAGEGSQQNNGNNNEINSENNNEINGENDGENNNENNRENNNDGEIGETN